MQSAYPTPPASPIHFSTDNFDSHECDGKLINGRLQVIGELGVGAYGVVYKAVDLLDPARTQYAVKALRKKGLEPRQQKFQDLEIQLHFEASNSSHPNIVRLKDIMEDDDFKYVILEYCPEGDLFSNITDSGRYVRNDLLAKQVFLQIIDAVMHCHAKEIYHRDLKPENILVTDDGHCVKLADFGLATRNRVTSDFGCGSTFYMSPECQQSSPRPFASYASAPNDVWSLGVILVNLTCGRNPWKRACVDDSTYSAYTKDRSFLKTILPVTDELNQILSMIFEPDPSQRITLPLLRQMILGCHRFTVSSQPLLPVPQQLTPPTTRYDSIQPVIPIEAPPSPPLQPYDQQPQSPYNSFMYPTPPGTPPLSAASAQAWIPNAVITPLSPYTVRCTDSGNTYSNGPAQSPVQQQQPSFTIVPTVPQKVVAFQQSQYAGIHYNQWFPQQIGRMVCYLQQPLQQYMPHLAPVAC